VDGDNSMDITIAMDFCHLLLKHADPLSLKCIDDLHQCAHGYEAQEMLQSAASMLYHVTLLKQQ